MADDLHISLVPSAHARPHEAVTEQCERCERKLLDEERAQSGDDPAQNLNAICLFCHSEADIAYVPLHIKAADAPAATTSAEPGGGDSPNRSPSSPLAPWRRGASSPLRSPVGGASRELASTADHSRCQSVLTRRNAVALPYSHSLRAHRGCKACWMHWEEQRVRLAIQNSQDALGEFIARCPMCDYRVDIRKTYDELLCKSCQKEVVAKGGNLSLAWVRLKSRCWHLRAMFGLICLGTIFGLQGIISLVVWIMCLDQLDGKHSLGTGNFSLAVRGSNSSSSISIIATLFP